jgi:hypothetical protein
LALAEKSLSFQAEVRNAHSQRTSQRAWAKVHKFDVEACRHRRIYNHSREALKHLAVFLEYLSSLHDITDDNIKMSGDVTIKMSGDVTEENRYGQRSDTLAWFWRFDNGLSGEEQTSPHMMECMSLTCR